MVERNIITHKEYNVMVLFSVIASSIIVHWKRKGHPRHACGVCFRLLREAGTHYGPPFQRPHIVAGSVKLRAGYV